MGQGTKMGVYYGKRSPTRMQGVLTRPFVGLNEYSPPTSLNENYMSDLLDVRPYRNEGLEFIVDSAITTLMYAEGLDAGAIRSVLVSSETTDTTYVFYVMASSTTFWKIHKLYYTVSTQTITSYDMTVDSLPALQTPYFCSSAIFTTEAETYYVFVSSHTKNLHFIRDNGTTETYDYTALPFYPKKILVHANRVFAIDTKNKFWWCRGGDLYSWYSLEYDDDALKGTGYMANGDYTLTGTLDAIRVITFKITQVNAADTLGKVTLVGTSPTGDPQTEVVNLVFGRQQTLKLWSSNPVITQSDWVQGGTTQDRIEIGWGPIGSGYVQDDAGFWTIERESVINDMCVLSGNLYLFTPNNIYIFQGYSPETFSLQLYIADIGIDILSTPAGYNCLATVRNTAYFLFNREVYEFNGQSQPKVISRPIMVNNAMTNSIMGGISLVGDDWVMSSTLYGLYVYQKIVNPAMYYYFDFETRTWWKKSGLINTDVSSVSNVLARYIPSYIMDTMFLFIIQANEPADFMFSTNLGRVHTVQPYIVTKAYNSGVPSETGTLTEVVLMMQGTSGASADIELLYSLTENLSDFVSIKAWENYIFNGDTEIITIPMPVSAIANAHHYRLKLIVGDSYTYPVRLFNIERRFRVQGRAR